MHNIQNKQNIQIQHHGAVNGVTGSCHQLHIDDHNSLLIDCGLFQGAETAGKSGAEHLSIEFDISTVRALLVTHCHIDHVGRIPYLLAAGFNGNIYTTQASASLLPLVIEDALKVGVTRDKKLIAACLKILERLIVPIDYKKWFELPLLPSVNTPSLNTALTVKARFQPAGHILGSAYIEIDMNNSEQSLSHRVVFSGDLGAPYTPLLPAPKSPYRADTLVIESTYGDKNHDSRKQRSARLKSVIEKAVADNGVVLIPAFSIGRTQELLYELEQIIHVEARKNSKSSENDSGFRLNNNSEHHSGHNSVHKPEHQFWDTIEVIVDSPMAANFTRQYRKFKTMWDKEAKNKLSHGRHPLDFDQLYTIDSHQEHLATINYLAKRNKPAIVIAASGMCSGGRIMNYLKRFLSEATADVIFVGYQAKGTPGRDIQKYGPNGGYVYLDHQKVKINAAIHTISGYSAHADQKDLVNFVKRMKVKPQHIRIVHGDERAKGVLADEYRRLLPDAEVVIGK